MKKHIVAGATLAMLAPLGIAAAQSSPALAVNVYTSPRIERGAQDALLALISLSAKDSNSAVQIPSVRIDTSFGNGAIVGDITDCRIRNLNNITSALNNGANAVGVTSGSTVIPLDAPFVVAMGTTATLALTCDIAPTAMLGGTIVIGTTLGSFTATVPGSGTTATVTVGKTTANVDGPLSGTATVVADLTPNVPSVPGVPNTGGDSTQNLILLAIAGIVALGGIFLARRLALR